jgi:Ser/Thr protein kinase RdoA (MazF antagonist)
MISDNLLSFAADSYGFERGTLHFTGDPTKTNQTYTFAKDGKGYIIKFARRPIENIRQTIAEMDWIYYLAENNISVSLPLKTNNNELVISIREKHEEYIITAFGMVNGYHWDKNNPTMWNDKIFFNWGKLMGDMHRLTKEYKPVGEYNVRDITNGLYWGSFFDCLKVAPSLYKVTQELICKIMALPKDKDSYGLIHGDMHQENFYIDGDKINIFDFDDSLCGWFALDIGIALFHALWWGRKDDMGNEFTNSIIKNFMKGYLTANHLSDFWISRIYVFMKYRQICAFIPWYFNPDNIDDNQKEWIYNIENDVLFTGCYINQSFFENMNTTIV